MAIDDLQIPQPHMFAEPTASKENTPKNGNSLAALRAIVSNNRNHANLTTTMRNATANPRDKYTKGQMPKIQDANPTAIFDLLDHSMYDEWDILPGGKLAAIPFEDEIMDIIQYEDIQ